MKDWSDFPRWLKAHPETVVDFGADEETGQVSVWLSWDSPTGQDLNLVWLVNESDPEGAWKALDAVTTAYEKRNPTAEPGQWLPGESSGAWEDDPVFVALEAFVSAQHVQGTSGPKMLRALQEELCRVAIECGIVPAELDQSLTRIWNETVERMRADSERESERSCLH